MKVKEIIRVIALFLIIIALLLFVADLVQVNNGRDVVGMYGLDLEEENSIDVALIGPSQIYASYYAPLAYKEYGYTSYSISTSAMAGSLYKYAVKEMQEKQNPQLYIFEISGFYYRVQRDEATMRKYLDNIPTYSSARLEAIDNLVDEEDKMSFYIPFIKYHNNISNIKDCFRVFKDKITIKKRGYSLFKNFATTTSIYDTTTKNIPKYYNCNMPDEALMYLDDLLSYLKECNIENVVFATFPDEYNREKTDSYLKAVQMIKDAGFVYEDFYTDRYERIGLDPKTDYYNVGHVNINGAEKVTKFLGQYIVDNYDINTQHTSSVTDEWNDCASYVDKVVSLAKERLEVNTDSSAGHQVYLESEFFYKTDTWKHKK